jgi:lipoprotein NlpI
MKSLQRTIGALAFVMLLSTLSALGADEESSRAFEQIAAARKALADGDLAKARELAKQAVEKSPDDDFARYVLRGVEAIARLNRAIEEDPKRADAWDARGAEYFKLGEIERSIADFDRAIELDPRRAVQHWQRGISLYYAGKYDEGAKQFEAYQTFDDNDVENAVWRYLCMARAEGVEKAAADILRIKRDPRVPMMQVYDLYKGDLKPDDVLAAVKAGEPGKEELNGRLFYAHLYLGLYYDAAGDAEQALEHVAAAERHKIGHYMWDVARVHAERLRKEE